ncbi:MAG: hypothetical protein KGI58_04010 [Patescibacteria group bacterium]|nr:hypothetical protein [Patescibacteria group bacterium]
MRQLSFADKCRDEISVWCHYHVTLHKYKIHKKKGDKFNIPEIKKKVEADAP